jgi:hypothetical protein
MKDHVKKQFILRKVNMASYIVFKNYILYIYVDFNRNGKLHIFNVLKLWCVG